MAILNQWLPRWRQQATLILIAALTPTALLGVNSSADDVPRVQRVPAPAMSEFERAVFGGHSEADARSRLDPILQRQIDAIDRACGLIAAQRKKLELAGRGEIKQLFERLAERQRVFEAADGADKNAYNFVRQDAETSSLRIAIRCAPFSDESLFGKTLRNVLTPEQVGQLERRSLAAATSDKRIMAANARDLVRTAKVQQNVHRILWSRDGSRSAIWEFGRPVEINGPTNVWVAGAGKRVLGFDFSPMKDVVAIAEARTATIINLATRWENYLRTSGGL